MSTKDAPAFDFYPERWTHGTRLMTKVERCDYIDLLCHQWTDDGLPADLDLVARLLGYKKGAMVPASVVDKFPVTDDGKRRNARLEIERTKQRERIARKSLGAAKTNAKRWGKDVADDSLSDRLASRLATVERVVSESPPPTTHPNKRESSAGAWPGIDEVKAYAPAVMATPDCAERFWNECEASGWINRHGQPIADWKPLFRNYATTWKANDHQRKTQRHAAPRQIPARSDNSNAPGRYA